MKMIKQLLIKENQGDTADRLEEIKDQIKELTEEALEIVRQAGRSGNTMTYERAKSYWYPHIVMALDKEHGYMGGSMHSMEDSIRELRDDGSEDADSMDLDPEDRAEYLRQRKNRGRSRP